MCHNCRGYALEPCKLQLLSPRATTTEARAPWTLCSATREATAMRNPSAVTKSSPISSQLGESLCSHKDLAQPKINKQNYFFLMVPFPSEWWSDCKIIMKRQKKQCKNKTQKLRREWPYLCAHSPTKHCPPTPLWTAPRLLHFSGTAQLTPTCFMGCGQD